MTTQEIIAYLEKQASNCAIVRDREDLRSKEYKHKLHWELVRLHILDLAAYIQANSN